MIKCYRGGGVDNKTKQISHGLKQCWTMVLEIVKDQCWVSEYLVWLFRTQSYGW